VSRLRLRMRTPLDENVHSPLAQERRKSSLVKVYDFGGGASLTTS
jgi:hypothetical protein